MICMATQRFGGIGPPNMSAKKWANLLKKTHYGIKHFIQNVALKNGQGWKKSNQRNAFNEFPSYGYLTF